MAPSLCTIHFYLSAFRADILPFTGTENGGSDNQYEYIATCTATIGITFYIIRSYSIQRMYRYDSTYVLAVGCYNP